MLYKLRDIFDLQMGKTPSRDNNMYWKDGNLPWVSISDLSKSQIYIENSKELITKFAVKDTLVKCIPKDTVIMSFKLSLGKTAITRKPLYTNEAIMAFIDKKVIQIEPKYIYFLFSYIQWGQFTNNAVKGKTLNKKFFSDFQINIPKYTQQTKVSSILIRINKILEYKRSLIEIYDALIKSRFDELFLNTHSIETMEIGELFEVGSSKRILQSELTTYGIPFYRVTDLINRINDRPVDIKQYVDELKYMTLIKEKYVPQAGDFLITARGTIGKIYEVKQNDKFYFQDGMITWLKRKNNYINNLFFMELVKTDWFRRQFYSSNNGTTISYLSITDTRHLKVLLPALNLQLQFAQEVYQINKLKSDVQKSIDETQLLMDSLMQEYFC